MAKCSQCEVLDFEPCFVFFFQFKNQIWSYEEILNVQGNKGGQERGSKDELVGPCQSEGEEKTKGAGVEDEGELADTRI